MRKIDKVLKEIEKLANDTDFRFGDIGALIENSTRQLLAKDNRLTLDHAAIGIHSCITCLEKNLGEKLDRILQVVEDRFDGLDDTLDKPGTFPTGDFPAPRQDDPVTRILERQTAAEVEIRNIKSSRRPIDSETIAKALNLLQKPQLKKVDDRLDKLERFMNEKMSESASEGMFEQERYDSLVERHGLLAERIDRLELSDDFHEGVTQRINDAQRVGGPDVMVSVPVSTEMRAELKEMVQGAFRKGDLKIDKKAKKGKND